MIGEGNHARNLHAQTCSARFAIAGVSHFSHSTCFFRVPHTHGAAIGGPSVKHSRCDASAAVRVGVVVLPPGVFRGPLSRVASGSHSPLRSAPAATSSSKQVHNATHAACHLSPRRPSRYIPCRPTSEVQPLAIQVSLSLPLCLQTLRTFRRRDLTWRATPASPPSLAR
jgi:hypothetical protein